MESVAVGGFRKQSDYWQRVEGVLGGYGQGSSANVNGNGNYWSSTWNSNTNAYNLNFNSSVVNPQNNNNKWNGFAVRCVKDWECWSNGIME
ncbi:hypothetical protein [Odoribacter lunatus]|uniref:hypothetical protein n=1 Tax=Odoribacter lunatus TaxID=2941335 RepID=UPI00203E6305|nr:hypothetical protein [Odoribacter lunatus]